MERPLNARPRYSAVALWRSAIRQARGLIDAGFRLAEFLSGYRLHLRRNPGIRAGKHPRRPRVCRPVLEALEPRYCLTSTVTVTAPVELTHEGSDDPLGKFEFKRTGDLTNSLNVSYAIESGQPDDAFPWSDYTLDGMDPLGTVSFPSGVDTVFLHIHATSDLHIENSEVVKVTVTASALSSYTVGDPASATITIQDTTPSGYNHAPITQNDSYNVIPNQQLSVAASIGVLHNDSDLDGNTLRATPGMGPPAHGSVNLSQDGSFTYTPNTGYHGSDSFVYRADDGLGGMADATVYLLVNGRPTAVDHYYFVEEDNTLTIAAPGVLEGATDADNDPLTAVVEREPWHGSLTLNDDGSFDYTPSPDFNGNDSFTYKVLDGHQESNAATVYITVNPVNDPPVAVNDSGSTNEDTSLTVSAPGVLGNDTDADGDALTAALVSGPSHGTLTFNSNGAGSFTYTPDANFNGTDSFTYQASDGILTSGAATVSITVNPVNDPPSFTLSGNPPASDEDAGQQTVSGFLTQISPGPANESSQTVSFVVTQSGGSLTFSAAPAISAGGTLTYTAAADANGTAEFRVVAVDSGSGTAPNVNTSAAQNFTITVNAVNDAPLAVDDHYDVNEGQPLTVNAPGVLGNDTDAESESLTVLGWSNPGHGTLQLNTDGSFTYTSEAGYIGADGFNYWISDGHVWSNEAAVTFTITHQNQPPAITAPASQQILEDAYLVFGSPSNLISVADPDAGNNPIQLSLAVNQGMLNLAHLDGLQFTSGADGSGSMTFRGTLSDINHALDGLRFTPPPNCNGDVTLSIAANDLGYTGTGGAKTDSDSVVISVLAVDDSPVVTVPADQSTPEDTSLIFSTANSNPISASDVDAGNNPVLTVLSVSAGTLTLSGTAGLTFTGGQNGSAYMAFTGPLAAINAALNGLQFTPPAEFSGDVWLGITVDDQGYTGQGGPLSDSQQVHIQVYPVNDPPVNIVPGLQRTDRNTAVMFGSISNNRIAVTDVDAGTADVQVTLQAVHGTVTLAQTSGLVFQQGTGNADAVVTFTGSMAQINADLEGLRFDPTADFAGTARLDITTNDLGHTGAGGPKSDTDTIPIIVRPDVFLSASEYTFSEGAGSAIITVYLSNSVDEAVEVSYATSAGTATPGVDYASASGTLHFAPHQTSASFAVPILDDALYEGTEDLAALLDNPVNARLGSPDMATVFIADNDPPPRITIDDVTRDEGNSGTTPFTFTVRLSEVSGLPAWVDYTTTAGTATSGVDYQVASGILFFPAGETTATVTVQVIGDRVTEDDETLFLDLSAPVNATLEDARGNGLILDDDPLVSLIAKDPDAAEGWFPNSGHFKVHRAGSISRSLTVYLSVSGTATPGLDYRAIGETVTILAGDRDARVSVNPIQDDVQDPDEIVVVTVAPDPADVYIIAQDAFSGTVNISDQCCSDEYGLPLPEGWGMNQGGVAQMRHGGESGSLGVGGFLPDAGQLDAAVLPADNSSLLWLSSRATPPSGDPDEPYGTGVTSPSKPLAEGTIVSLRWWVKTEDYTPFADFATGTLANLDWPGHDIDLFHFTQTRDHELSTGWQDVTVVIPRHEQGSDVLTDHYQLLFSVVNLKDNKVETELFIDALSGFQVDHRPSYVTIGASDGTAAEEDLDPGQFVVSRSGPVDADLAVGYSIGGTAQPNKDYNALTGVVIIPAGQVSAVIDVLPRDDWFPESTETVVVRLVPGHYLIPCEQTATVEILDNDSWLTVTHRTADPLDGLAREQTGNVQVQHDFDLDLSPGREQALDPSLVYNSDSVSPRPIFQAFVPTDPDRSKPTITLTLTWDEASLVDMPQFVTRSIDPDSYTAGQLFTVGLQLPNAVIRTGRHTWRVHLSMVYPNPADQPDPIPDRTGTTFVDVEDASPYGAGWTWSMMDQLVDIPQLTFAGTSYPAGQLRLFGTGGWRFYARQASPILYVNGADNPGDGGAFAAVPGVGPDPVAYTYAAVDGQLRRFDAATGLQTDWLSADGHETVHFSYDGAGRLNGLTAIDGSQSLFNYGTGGLTSVVNPAGRVTGVASDGVRLGGFVNPDGGVRTFTYDTDGRLTQDNFAGFTQDWTWTAQGILDTYTLGTDQSYVVKPAVAVGLVSPWVLQGNAASVQVQGKVTDALNHTTIWEMDERARPLKQIAADGGIRQWRRDLGRTWVNQEIDPLLRVTTYIHDSHGNVTGELFADGTSRSYGWVELGTDTHPMYRLETSGDERGWTTFYDYDAEGHLTEEVDPLGHSRSQIWTLDGLLMMVTDRRGVSVEYIYDTRRRQTHVTEAWEVSSQQRTTVTTYDDTGNVETVSRPRDYEMVASPDFVVTRYLYDAMNRPTVVIEADNVPALQRATTTLYDGFGHVVSVAKLTGDPADPQLVLTSMLYDTAGRRTMVMEAWNTQLARSTETEYDRAGNVLEVSDPLGHITHYGYDPVNRLRSVTEAYGMLLSQRTTTTLYDLGGNLTGTIDARGVGTSYEYDRRNRVTTMVEAVGVPGQRTTTTGYDPAGNVEFVTRPLTPDILPDGSLDEHPGRVRTKYVYDALNRRTEVIEAFAVENVVNEGLRRTTVTEYDEEGNVLSVTTPRAYDNQSGPGTPEPRTLITSYEYDALGRRIRTIEAYHEPGLERTTQTGYDAANNVIWVSTPRDYDNPVTWAPGASVTTSYVYDELNRQVEVIEAVGTAVQRRSTLEYDVADHVVKVTAGIASSNEQRSATRYEYDVLGRRTDVYEADGSDLERRTQTHYDADDNVQWQVAPNGAITSYMYDLLNRRIGIIEAFGDMALQRMTWTEYDAADHVTSVTKPVAGIGGMMSGPAFAITHYGYDALGRQTSMIEGWMSLGLQRTTTMEYDARDHLVSVTRPLDYDVFSWGGLLNSGWVQSSNVVRTVYTYDVLGRRRQVIEADGIVGAQGLERRTTTAYDAADNVRAVTQPIAYDSQAEAGGPNPRDVTTRYRYDALNRKVEVIEGYGITTDNGAAVTLQRTTSLGYDAADHLIGQQRSQAYDRKVGNEWVMGLGSFTTTYEYDARGRQTLVIEVVTLGGRTRTTRSEYNSADNMVLVKQPRKYDDETWTNADPKWVLTKYEYDVLGRRVKMVEALGEKGSERTTTYGYDEMDNLTGETHPRDYDAESHDDEGPELIESPVDGVTREYTYDLLGRRVRIIEAANITGLERTTLFRYNARGDVISEIHARVYGILEDAGTSLPANTVTTSYGYDVYGRRTSVIEAYGDNGANGLQRTTRTYYDAMDHVWYVERPLLYDGQMLPPMSSEPRTVTTSYGYDALGRQTKVVEGYDLLGSTPQNPNRAWLQRTTERAYDARDNLLSETKPIAYDLEPWNEATQGPARVTTRYGYDALGRRVKQIEGYGLTSLTDPSKHLQHTTTMAYDAADDLVAVRRSLAYDQRLDGAWVTGSLWFVTEYRYDALGRQTEAIELVSAQLTTGEPWLRTRTTRTGYDAADRVAWVAEPRWYDEESLPAWMGTVRAVTTVYQYDALGRRTRVIEAEGLEGQQRTASYGFDAADRVLVEQRSQDFDQRAGGTGPLTLPTTKVLTTRHAYDELGREVKTIAGYGLFEWVAMPTDWRVWQATTTQLYDAADRLVSQTRPADYDHTASPLTDPVTWQQAADRYTTQYGYDALGRRTRLLEQVELGDAGRRRTTLWRYDAADRLLTEFRPLEYGVLFDPGTSPPAGTVATSYGYDALGRRRKVIEAYGVTTNTGAETLQHTSMMWYDAADRLVSQTRPQGYDTRLRDEQGFFVFPTVWVPTGEVVTRYRYDPLGRQTEITEAVGKALAQRTTTMAYDAAGDLASVTRPLGPDLDANGLDVRAWLVGVRTDYEHDWLGRRVQTTEAANFPELTRVSRTAYDAQARPVEQRIPSDVLTQQFRLDTLEYDALGRQTRSVQDAVGWARTTTTGYDAMDHVTSTIDPLGAVTRFGYDLLGRQTEVSEAYGLTGPTEQDPNRPQLQRTTRTGYDPAGEVLWVRKPLEYDPNPAQPPGVQPKSVVTSLGYDGLGRRVLVTEAVGENLAQRTTTTEYDPVGHVRLVSSPLGYDRNGSGAAVANPGHLRTRYQYDVLGRRTAMTEAVGENGLQRTTSYGYDASDNRTWVSKPLGYDIDPSGNALARQAATATYGYDALNRLVRVTDPVGRVTTTGYDAADHPALQIDALGLATTTTFDVLGRREQVENPDGTVLTWKYTPADKVREQSETYGPRTLITSYTYDALGRARVTYEPRGGTDTMGPAYVTIRWYDLADHVKEVVSPPLSGAVDDVTHYDYDELGRLKKVTDRRQHAAEYRYDAADRLAWTKDRDGRQTSYTYDVLGRLQVEDWLGFAGTDAARPSPADQYLREYDAADRLTAASNDSLGAYGFAYDALGRQTASLNPNGLSLTFRYDAADRRTGRSELAGGVTASVLTSEYNAAGELTARSLTADAMVLEVRETHTARGQVESLRRRAPATAAPGPLVDVGRTTYSYDPAGRTTRVDHSATTQVSSSLLLPLYVGGPLEPLEAIDSVYDRGQLQQESSDYAKDPFLRVFRYGTPPPDIVGDLIAAIDFDLLTGAGKIGTWLTTQDFEGNITSRVQFNLADWSQRWDYTYDHAHRVIKAELLLALPQVGAGWVKQGAVKFQYDPLGNLVGLTGVEGWSWTETYAYDGREVWADFDLGNGVVSRYLYAEGVAGPAARLDASTSPEVRGYFRADVTPVRWYFADRNGGVRQLTDQFGQVLLYYKYDGAGEGQPTAPSMLAFGATALADRWRGGGQPWWVGRAGSALTERDGRLESPDLGRLLGGSPDELGRGEYNPERNTGHSPTGRGNGGPVDWVNAYAGEWLADFWDPMVGKRRPEDVVRERPDVDQAVAMGYQTDGFRGAVGALGTFALAENQSGARIGRTWRSDWDTLWRGPPAWTGWLGGQKPTSLMLLDREFDNAKRGAVDTLSFGVSRSLREAAGWWLGLGDGTDYESDGYFAGTVAGTAAQLAIDVGLMFVPGGQAAGIAEGASLVSGVGRSGIWALRMARATGEGVHAAEAVGLGLRGSSWVLRGLRTADVSYNLLTEAARVYNVARVAGAALQTYEAARHNDVLGAGLGALNLATSAFHLPVGNFNPCASSRLAYWTHWGLRGVDALGQVAVMGRDVSHGQFVQAGLTGTMLVASHLMQMLRACFEEGTPLRFPGGSKPIEQFEEGDEILSRVDTDPSAPVVVSVVEKKFVRTGRVLRLHFQGGVVIGTTAEHPFWLKDEGWTAAGALRVGDVVALEDGWRGVEEVVDTGEYKRVYNLRVAQYHTYFVGTLEWGFSVWAHNEYGDWIRNSAVRGTRQLVGFFKRMVRKSFLVATDLAELRKLLVGQAKSSSTKLGAAWEQLEIERQAWHRNNPTSPLDQLGEPTPGVQMTAVERTAADVMRAETPSSARGSTTTFHDELGFPVRHGNVAEAHLRQQKAVADQLIEHHGLSRDTAIVLYNDALRVSNDPFTVANGKIHPDVQVFVNTESGWRRVGLPVEIEPASGGHAHKVELYTRQHAGGAAGFHPVTYPG